VSLPVRTTRESDEQIRQIDDWWRTNRPTAPDLFLHELTTAFEIIGDAPYIGRAYRRSPIPATRRFLLAACRYHVYYVPQTSDVIVLAVWHARRGAGPPLRVS